MIAAGLVPFRVHQHHHHHHHRYHHYHHCRLLSVLLLVLLVLLPLLALLLRPPPPTPWFLARRWRVLRRPELFLPRLVETAARRTGRSGRPPPPATPITRRLRCRWNRGLFVASPLRRADRLGGDRCPSAFSLRIPPNLAAAGHAAQRRYSSRRDAGAPSLLALSCFFLSHLSSTLFILLSSSYAPLLLSPSLALSVSLSPSLSHPPSLAYTRSLSRSRPDFIIKSIVRIENRWRCGKS